MELPNILTIVRQFDHQQKREHDAYPEVGGGRAPAERLAALGERYLDETRPIRAGQPRFIDKMPNNFSHIGLIHAILPNATIIDVRRHPMDACFSAYKQHFAEGQSFTYDLDDLGRYYRATCRSWTIGTTCCPARYCACSTSDWCENPEATIRRLLAHCGLPFEPACLSFHRDRSRGAHRELRAGAPARCTAPASATGDISSASWSPCAESRGLPGPLRGA